MNRIIRTGLLFCSLLLFAAITPLVILYAIGYRLNLHQITPTAIGVLLLDTVPHRANILVNGELLGKTPRAISNLKPGDVTVRFELPSYQPWEKHVHIESTLTTDFQSVRLFPEKAPQKQLGTKVAAFALSPNSQLLAIAHSDATAEIIDGQSQLIVVPTKLPFLPSQMLWAPDNASVLLWSQKQVALLTLADGAAHSLRISDFKEGTFMWDTRLPNRLLYITTVNQLVALNTNNLQKNILLSNVSQAALAPKGIVVVTLSGVVSLYDFSGQLVREIDNYSDKKVEQLKVGSTGTIAAVFNNHTAAILSDTGMKNIATDVNGLGWSPDGTLLYLETGPNEIRVYNESNDQLSFMGRGETQLITRLSQPIHFTSWFPDNLHLIYQINDEITIIEIDTRDHPLTYKVDTTNLGEPLPITNSAGTVMYYLKKVKGETTLIQSNLTLP